MMALLIAGVTLIIIGLLGLMILSKDLYNIKSTYDDVPLALTGTILCITIGGALILGYLI